MGCCLAKSLHDLTVWVLQFDVIGIRAVFFQLLTGTSERKAVNTVAKNALKSVKFPSLKVIEDIQLRKVAKFYGRLSGGGHVRANMHWTNAFNISRLCGSISSLSLYISSLNLVS